MSDVDDLLDDLDSEDDEDPTPQQDRGEALIQDFRRRERNLKKALKEAEAKAEAYAPYKEKFLSQTLPEIAKEAGADPAFATFYAKELGDRDPSVEDFKTWAAESKVPLTPMEEDAPQTRAAEGNFQPTVGGEAPGRQKYDREWTDRMMKDGHHDEVFQVIARGQVEFDNPEAQSQADER